MSYIELTCTAWGGGFEWTRPAEPPCPFSCPVLEPIAGDACLSWDVLCVYGDDPRLGCRAHYRCRDITYINSTYASTWIQGFPAVPCPPLDRAACPATPADATGACSPEQNICVFSDGAQCACLPSATGPEWSCAPAPAQGCPAVSPTAFQPCATSQQGLLCTYGLCEAGTFASLVCNDDKLWEDVTSTPCP